MRKPRQLPKNIVKPRGSRGARAYVRGINNHGNFKLTKKINVRGERTSEKKVPISLRNNRKRPQSQTRAFKSIKNNGIVRKIKRQNQLGSRTRSHVDMRRSEIPPSRENYEPHRPHNYEPPGPHNYEPPGPHNYEPLRPHIKLPTRRRPATKQLQRVPVNPPMQNNPVTKSSRTSYQPPKPMSRKEFNEWRPNNTPRREEPQQSVDHQRSPPGAPRLLLSSDVLHISSAPRRTSEPLRPPAVAHLPFRPLQ